MNEKLSSKITIKQTIFILWLAFAIFIGLFIIGMNSANLINSDDASELILAKMLSKENRFLSRNWIYSSELRVINTQIIRALLFKLTDSWAAVRVVGNLVLYLWLLSAYAFFIRQWKIGNGWFWYTAPFLLIPFSHDAFYVIGLMAYYIPHMAFSFMLLGGWMYLYQGGKHRKRMHIFVMACAFLACLGGIRQIAMTILPILLTVCVLLLEHSYEIGSFKRFFSKYYYLWTSTICGLLGYFVNLKVLSRWYHFDSYQGMHLIQPTFDRLQMVLRGFLNVFGYTEEGVPETEVFTIGGIFYLLSLGFMVLVIFLAAALWKQRRQLKLLSQALLWFSLMGLFLQLFLFMFTDAPFAPRYFVLNLIMFVPLLIIFYQESGFSLEIKRIFIVFTAVVLCMLGGREYWDCLKSHGNEGRMASISYLQEEDYSLGYASFWNANVVTELTNGKIEMVNLQCEREEKPNLYPWLTKLSTLFPREREGQVFLLLHKNELNRYEALITDKIPAFTDEQYCIYIYEDANEVLDLLE